MKNKISTFLTGFSDSVIENQKNRKKRKEKMSSDPDEDNILLKRKKYLSIDAKLNAPTTIPHVPAINDKIKKEKKKKILRTSSTHSYRIEDIAVKDFKKKPPNIGGTVISEIEKFAEPSSFPTHLTLFSSLKSKFNSPLPHLVKQRSTSTPIAGSEGQKVYFNMEPLTPIKELIEIPSSLPKQTNIKREVISELPPPSVISVPKNKRKLMTSEKLKLGIFNSIPKFCPFCDYVCERLISHHIETIHWDKLKMPISTSVNGINKIITSFAKNKKMLMPLQHVVNIMGDYWFNPEIRKIGNLLCNLAQITTYGGSWELNHVPEVSNPFEQYIVTSKLQSE